MTSQTLKIVDKVGSDDKYLCRISLVGVGLLACWAIAHSLNLIGTLDLTRSAGAAQPTPSTYTMRCSGPDDLGFYRCGRSYP